MRASTNPDTFLYVNKLRGVVRLSCPSYLGYK
jgi:hypothetical protein